MIGLGGRLAARRKRRHRVDRFTNRREEIEFNAGLYGGGTVERLERIDHFLGRRPRADRLLGHSSSFFEWSFSAVIAAWSSRRPRTPMAPSQLWTLIAFSKARMAT